MESELRRELSEDENKQIQKEVFRICPPPNYQTPRTDNQVAAMQLAGTMTNYSRSLVLRGYTECAQHSAPLSLVVELYGAITAARNRLYDNIPTGQIEAFQLITLISSHLKDLDAILTKAQQYLPQSKDATDAKH